MYEATKDEIRRHGRQTEYQRRCLLCEDTGFVDIGYCKDGYHWVWPCECRRKGA
nr:MAG TPA: Prim-pol 4 [Caudoviricetes sp.]